ncbi:hypothetical protein ACFLIM_05375 [Nonomuraea sp. M3C6]|uniref:DUF11 domain-containing protein n=1 Tax=Nonomuraea marmarensis TaxID=3351344 RepID=A0ABW7A5L2_9ACTN
MIAVAGRSGGRRIASGSSRHGTFTRGYDMGMPGIAAIIALATFGGWSTPAAATVPRSPDLQITAAVTPDPVIIGTESVYTVTVMNTGDQTAENATITDTLDPNITPGTLQRDCSLAGQTVTCGGPGLTIPPGESVTYEIPITIDPALPDGTEVANHAWVSATGVDGDSTRLISRTRTTTDVDTRPPTATPTVIDTCATVPMNNRSCTPAATRAPNSTHTPNRAPAATPTPSPGTVPPATAPTKPSPTNSLGAEHGFGSGPREPGRGEGERPGRHEPRPGEGITPDGPGEGFNLDGPGAGSSANEGTDEGADEGADVPRSAAGGALPGPAAADRDTVPMTGVSLWMLGLGVSVLLALGLLVRYFSGRDQASD